MTWYVFFLFLHIFAALLAFGTAMLAFPFMGAFASREPEHLNFALRLRYALGRRAVTPLAAITLALGIVLIVLGHWDLFGDQWLLISIILFVVMVGEAQLLTLPAVGRLVELTGSPDAESSSEVANLLRKMRVAGVFSSLLLASIILLMVWKPGS
ncbi:MAG: DUF2269 domain-containing protein [Actinomycetota bacterium]|nr:DUF2269 domain-containing protein [Actinomycetota bacterium]